MGEVAPASLLEIDLDAIAGNWRFLDARHQGATAGIVKADAYGLGAAPVAAKLFAAGCRHFFTATLGEAMVVRPYVPGAMLAVLHGCLAGEEPDFLAHDLVPVLTCLPGLARWSKAAKAAGKALPAILHADTGMSRLGLSTTEMAALRDDPALLAGIQVEYLLTHLISSELPDAVSNALQLNRFNALRVGFPGVKTSIANSSGMFLGREFAADLFRPGAALYGLNPTPGAANPMRPVIRLTARILRITEIQPGDTVGYNATWTASRPSRIATVSVGYADGYMRSLSNAATARFDATPLPLVGRVSMDLTTFDVTDAPQAGPGDSLELIGPLHGADDLAIEAGTNGYEILTSLGRRYQRRYAGAIKGL